MSVFDRTWVLIDKWIYFRFHVFNYHQKISTDIIRRSRYSPPHCIAFIT